MRGSSRPAPIWFRGRRTKNLQNDSGTVESAGRERRGLEAGKRHLSTQYEAQQATVQALGKAIVVARGNEADRRKRTWRGSTEMMGYPSVRRRFRRDHAAQHRFGRAGKSRQHAAVSDRADGPCSDLCECSAVRLGLGPGRATGPADHSRICRGINSAARWRGPPMRSTRPPARCWSEMQVVEFGGGAACPACTHRWTLQHRAPSRRY